MANNRMAIVCRCCNEEIIIGKILGTDYYVPPMYEDNLVEKLNIFYEKHACCHKFLKDIDFENQFKLRYEHKKR